MIECPSCGRDNRLLARFCQFCGTPMAAALAGSTDAGDAEDVAELEATPEEIGAAISRIKDSEHSWRTFAGPWGPTFRSTVALMLEQNKSGNIQIMPNGGKRIVMDAPKQGKRIVIRG